MNAARSTSRQDIFDALEAARAAIDAGKTRKAARELRRVHALVVLLIPPAPSPETCPSCGIGKPSAKSLAEHRYYAHGAAEPEHWQADR